LRERALFHNLFNTSVEKVVPERIKEFLTARGMPGNGLPPARSPFDLPETRVLKYNAKLL
jgi:hypothetical protein